MNEQSTQIKAGDIVNLKHGSPDMVVVNTHGKDIVVTWFDDCNQVKEWSFPENILIFKK